MGELDLKPQKLELPLHRLSLDVFGYVANVFPQISEILQTKDQLNSHQTILWLILFAFLSLDDVHVCPNKIYSLLSLKIHHFPQEQKVTFYFG